MFLTPKSSRIRLREAQRARNNRSEIHRALSLGQITRRDLIKWGIVTSGGILVCKNGLSPLAPSAFADDVPTGTPPSPLFGAKKFVARMPRLDLQHPVPMTKLIRGQETDAVFGGTLAGEPNARRLSYHTDFSTPPPGTTKADFTNPITGKGPIEGRPPGELFAHQRWDEFFPKVGYVLSLSQLAANQSFFPNNGSAPSWGRTPFGRMPVATPISTHRRERRLRPSSRVGTANPSSPASITICPPTAARTAASGATSTNCTSTTPTTARKAMALPTCTTSRAPSLIIAGAPRSPAATRSISTQGSLPPAVPMVTAALSGSPVTSVSTREPCGPTTTGSSSRLRMSTRACS